MNLERTQPIVNEFRGDLQPPDGDIEVSLKRLDLDIRYGSQGREFFRLLAAYLLLSLQGVSAHG